MKIPRLSSGPMCYSLEQWASRMAFSDLILGIFLAVVFFYASSLVDDTYSPGEIDEQTLTITKAVCITIGVVFCLVAFFAIILLVGLYQTNKTLLLVWCYYAMVGCVIFLLFFGAAGILMLAGGLVQAGVFLLFIAVLATGHQIYSALIIHSIYLKFKEAEENHTSYAQQS